MDHWVRWIKGVCDRYSPGDAMMPVVALEQNRAVESRGCFRPLG